MRIDDILSRLEGARPKGSGWIALCSAHEDRNASLSIHEHDGKILLKCFAGCSTEAILAAMGLQMSDLFTETNSITRRIEAVYDYTDEAGTLLFQTVRYDPKDFRQRRPDGNGGWIYEMKGVKRVLYRLPEVSKATSVLVVEGEKDCETARRLCLIGTTNPHGSAGKWREEYSECLRGKRVAIIADADEPGQKHARDVARSLVGVATSIKLIEALPASKDLSDWVAKGGTREKLLAIIAQSPELTTETVAKWKGNIKPAPGDPWAAAETMETFLSGGEEGAEFLDTRKRLIARSSVTEIFSPRGLGKSLFAMWLALDCARRGLRVLLLDRDNPRRDVRNRLRSFVGDHDIVGLKILSREKCPPLTKAKDWAAFPYSDYDLVILDSLDSATEGVGEQDSSKPSRAFAPLLDIARRENGPSVLVLGNTIKSGQNSRGSGVIEDRADIVYEVRDATDFHPSGSKPSWVEELPPAGVGNWAARSSRRKQRSKYRLAFTASKFRIGVEPEPFILEIDTSMEPWTVADVTNLVDSEGAAERERRASEKREIIAKAVAALVAEINRRAQASEPPMTKRKDAEGFLMLQGLKRGEARETLDTRNGKDWSLFHLDGKTIAVLPLGYKKEKDGHILPSAEPSKTLAITHVECGRPISMHPATFDNAEDPLNSCSTDSKNVAKGSLYTPHGDGKAALIADQEPPASELWETEI
jgi:5S rRNA maturation endonuclease (ribonuclease M5)